MIPSGMGHPDALSAADQGAVLPGAAIAADRSVPLPGEHGVELLHEAGFIADGLRWGITMAYGDISTCCPTHN